MTKSPILKYYKGHRVSQSWKIYHTSLIIITEYGHRVNCKIYAFFIEKIFELLCSGNTCANLKKVSVEDFEECKMAAIEVRKRLMTDPTTIEVNPTPTYPKSCYLFSNYVYWGSLEDDTLQKQAQEICRKSGNYILPLYIVANKINLILLLRLFTSLTGLLISHFRQFDLRSNDQEGDVQMLGWSSLYEIRWCCIWWVRCQ